MIGTIIGIIFVLIVLGVIWWAIQQLLPLIPMGEPFATIVRVLCVLLMVLVVLWVIMQLLGMAGVSVPFLKNASLITPAQAQVEFHITPEGGYIGPSRHRGVEYRHRGICRELREACLKKEELGEVGEGNCRRYRETCR